MKHKLLRFAVIRFFNGSFQSFPLFAWIRLLVFFLVLDGSLSLVTGEAHAQTIRCVLHCRDTSICFNIPDSMVQLTPPTYTFPGGPNGGTGGAGTDCQYDSIWNNAPLVFPVGTTVVTWYVWAPPGILDSCTSNVTRNPPSSYTISFNTSPPIVGGVINICNGQSITFNDNSTGINGLLWNFGNGYYSSNATHTEPAWHYPPGTYYDTLTVYDDCGTPHDTAFMVVVDSASGPDIFCISVVCPGDTVTYHTSAVCSNYTWGVTGGTFLTPPPPTSDSCTIVWGPGPSGTITLSVAGCAPPLNCPNPTIKTVNIVPATLPIAGDTIVCSGSTSTYCVECIPGNLHNWELMPANAGTISGQGTCCVTIQWTPGFFGNVTLTLNYQNVLTGSGCNLPGNCSHDPGCGGTATINITVKPIFGISGPTTVCPNTTNGPFNGMNLTNNTVVTGTSWKVQTPVPTTLTFGSTAAFNAYTWNAGPGAYYVTAYAPAGVFCNDSAFLPVNVVNMIAPDTITGPDTVCAGIPFLYNTVPNMGGVSYNWTVTNGTIIGPSNGNSVMIQWNLGGGTVSVSQTLNNPPGCTSPPSPVFSVYTWPNFSLPVITPSASIACVKSTITYSIPPSLINNGTYTWSVSPATAGNIVSANGTNQIVINWIDASNTPIFVKLKISRCYTDSVMFPVNLLGLPPVPNIIAPATVCKNSLVSFSTSSPGPIWNWNFGDAGTANTQSTTHTYLNAGDYNVSLTITNVNGCSDTAFTKIHVDDIPQTPVITGPSSVCSGSTVSYTFSQPVFNGANYIWSVTPPGVIQTGQGTSSIVVKWNSPTLTGLVSLVVQSNCPPAPVTPFPVVVNALPVAGIAIPSPLCVGAPLTFTGSGGTTYNWSFPGASNVNLTNPAAPVVTYGVAGNYSASLSIIDANGCTANKTVNYTVNPLPLVNVTANGVCTFPATVNINTINTGGYTYLWNTSATTASITQTLTGPTSFSVTVTNSFGCTNTGSILVAGGICAPIPGVCPVNDSLDFIATPPVCLTDSFFKLYNGNHTGWDFGDGGNAGAINPVVHTFPTPGIYNVTIMGTAYGLDAFGQPCTTAIGAVHPITIPFDAAFNVTYQCNGLGQMQTIINNTSLYLNSATSYSWKWYLDGNLSPFSSVHSPTNQLFSAGSHNIKLIISDPGGTQATCTLTVAINVPVPVTAAMNAPSPAPFCAGTPVNFSDASFTAPTAWNWDFYNNGVSTSNLQNPQFTYPSPGTFTYKLTVSDQYSCSSVTTNNITINAAGTGTITIDTTYCDSIKLTASGIGPFVWSNVFTQPVPDNPFYVKQNGYYSVVGNNPSFGCPYRVTVGPLTIRRTPNPTITGRVRYCQGENLDLKTNTAGVTVAWTPYPTGPVLGTNPNLTIVANTPGTFTYKVTLTSANGCSASDTISVTVDPVPSSAVIVASGPLTFCEGDSINLQLSPPAATYLWSKSPTPPLSPPTNAAPILWVTQSGTYSLIAQTPNGCAYPAIPPVTITVNPLPAITISGDTVICQGKTLSLTATQISGASYVWVGPATNTNTNPLVKTNMQFSDAGVYVVTVTSPNGCTITRSVNVIVNPSPAPPFIVSNPGGVLCEGQLYNLFVTNPAGAGHVYNWSTGQMGLSINAVLQGDYSVVVTNNFGCKANSNVLTIHPTPDLSCAPTGCYEFCNECDSVTIPGPAGLNTYNWNILVGNVFLPYSTNQNLTVLPPGGAYQLVATNIFGCADSTDTLKIDFKDCCPAPDPFACLDTCEHFDNNMLNDFGPHPNAPNVIVSTSNVNSQAGPSDYYLFVQDQPGSSRVLASYLYDGKWCCGSFCYDFRLMNDGGTGANVNPSFTIMNGTLGFTFTSTVVANQGNGWHSICAPITDCNPPPVSGAGIWTPVGATLPTDWLTVLGNVTEVVFPADYTAATNEVSALDNICINSNVPNIDAGPDTAVCIGTVLTLHVTGCTGTPQWSQISGDTLIPVGNGPIVDVIPTQNTCYVVTCCGIQACCCDTDTICVNVLPLPIIQWNFNYGPLCQGSDSVYLDTANVSVYVYNVWTPLANAGGTWTWSGVGVIGNYFYPNLLGPNAVTLTYTDSAGCSASLTKYFNVIYCCPDTCQADAGPDHVVCLGQPFTLNTSGCDSSKWYQLSGDTLIQVGTGNIVDIFPQQDACYMLVCYQGCCVDSDTVCVIVSPPPVIQWNFSYNPVCQGSDSIYLDTANVSVYINNNWVPLNNAPGTWIFSGVQVIGNYFYPNILGPNSITITYTDSLGCSASITKYIGVIYCCPDTCQADAGPDHVVCLGQPFTLNTSGCDSSKWYQLSGDTVIQVGTGNIVDIFPQQDACYMLVCYQGCCVDSDTVCVIVSPPPVIQWNWSYTPVCQGSDSIYLDTANISVYINNNWVPLNNAPGTWIFSGVQVIGNYFYPNILGPNAITITYTDSLGCSASITKYIGVISCCQDTCNADAGPDHVVCLGQPFTLYTSGCDSSKWYQITNDSLIQVGTGNIVDIFPQQNTCYLLVCYQGCCVDWDTVCVMVNPPPVIQWNWNYTPVCQGSDSIYLDTTNISVYINNNWIPLANAPGTWSFSGVQVIGNYFHPNIIGPNAVTITYTDTLGCSASVTQYIGVIYCCPDTCQANAGPDHIVCLGEPFTLYTNGCDSSKWYQILQDTLVQVGTGNIVDVFPQQNSCYVLVCYQGCCVDTDTVCVIVNPPPVIQWNWSHTPVCIGSDSIYLDTANISVYINNNWIPLANAPGTWTFSGVQVIGNYFYPNILGPNAITITYTDSLGCSASITKYIGVISCCQDTCNADAGQDHVVCLGQPFTLYTSGCDSSKWYQMIEDTLVQVGTGNIVDVFPQQNTCYVLVCYQGCCVDWDTVCVIVNPPPVIQWNFNFTPVCFNGDSVLLDTSFISVFINNTWVPLANAPGSYSFNGVGVVGNYFHPSLLGLNAITFTYTDSLGCSTSITKYVNVITCCVNTCPANAGPDQTICQGQPAILQTQGCDSSATWYQMGPEGLTQVGIGQIVDVIPQQTTCYVLICCGGNNCCCDTDTVCIFVNPLPILQWTMVFPDVCSNAGPVLLDTANIFVFINNAWVPVAGAGGSGIFVGPGVTGNTFTPPGLGTFTITYYYTDANGCSASISKTINVISCGCDPISCGCNNVPPPPAPTITVISVDPDNCHNDGCIHITATGCCLQYSYSYFDPCNPLLSYSVPQSPNPSILCNLRAGNYIIYVQDACGNFAQQNVTVPLASGPLTAFVQYGMCGDSICVQVEGGCPPYSYDWGGGVTTQCIHVTERCVGMSVTITDSRGCSITKLLSAPQINFTDVVNPGCCSPTGSMCVTGCFGQPPYSYLWSNGATTQCVSGLPAGNYCVTITNGAGEQFTCCHTLVDMSFTPPNVSFNFNNCGSMVTAVISQTGCGQYTYHWENNSTELFRESVHPCDSLTFTIVGCDGSQTHFGFRVPQVLASISPVNCATGFGTICASVECFRCPPYSYSWSPSLPWQDNGSACFNAQPGFYNLCVTNSCGDVICCQFYLPPVLNFSLNFNVIGACIGINNGSAHAFVSGGTPPYSYSWSNGGTTPAISGLAPGVYTLTVMDANGCVTTSSVVVPSRRCGKWIDVHVLLDGFYQNTGSTTPMDNLGVGGCLHLAGVSANPSDVDTVRVTLVDPLTLSSVDSSFGIVQTDGSMTVIFEDTTLDGHSYYLKLNHRSSLETWSSVPVSMTDPVYYDFTDAATRAFGDNLRDLGNGLFAVWSGDVDQDGVIGLTDFSLVESTSQQFVYGYVVNDITGDIMVESADYSLIENNAQLFLISLRP
ncbi:MAG: PKD domain-containing protein [Bacteroidetes bacterium]|nr:PKD domain-containing protein [Bacteroidota bacterium]